MKKIQQRGSRRPRKAHREKRARIFGINFPDEIIKTASPCKRVRLFLYQLLNNKTELRNFISDMLFCPLRMRTKTIAISLTKKHMACCKKYKALILKYVPYISKIYALYFSPFQTPETQQLTKPQNQHQKRPRNEVNSDVLPHILSVSPGILSAITFAIYAVIQPYPLSAHRIRTLRKRLFLIFAPTFHKHETEKSSLLRQSVFP